MKKVHYNKLIRDRIPERIKCSGGECSIKQLGQKEFEKELIKKVGEEASGLCAAKTRQELVAELADVLDVVDEIRKIKKIRAVELEKAQKENMRKKGGFSKRLFLFWSSETGYRTNERTYKKAA